MSRLLTQEEFVNKANQRNKYVKIIGKYINSKEKIECQCLLCGEHFYSTSTNIFAGKKHRECAIKISAKARTKTHEQFVEEIKNIRQNIEIIDIYTGAFNDLMCYCNIHDEYFKSAPTHLLKGKCGCQKCRSEKISKKLMKENEEFILEVKDINPNIEIIGVYNGAKSTIEVKCLKCGFVWEPIASSVLSGFGCPHCVGRNKTTEEFKKEIKVENPNVKIIGEYVDTNTNIECRCKICNNVWFANPSNLKYSGCPVCRESHGEKRIRKYLMNNDINFIPQKTFDNLLGVGGRNLSYDFYLPDYKTLIEYQGEYHDGTVSIQTEEKFKIQQEHDKRKKQYAKLNKITLLEIWYWDYQNIEEILENEIHI